ncbi:MAG: MFS transporter [Methanobacteriaceae archaeon]|nr:MFS transporter [Methanobacteriaceae archaeon]
MNNNQKFPLLIVSLGAFLIPFMGTALNIAVPSIAMEFMLDAVFITWVPTAFILGNAAFLLIFGKIGDIYGRKRIFQYGILIFTLASIAALISNNSLILLISIFSMGIGSSMMYANAVAILSSVFKTGKRGGALGVYVSSVYAGILAGSFLGGILTSMIGWRSIFIFVIPLGFFLILLIVWKFPQDWRDAKRDKLDFKGSIIYLTSIISIMYGISIIDNYVGFLPIILGLTGLIIFIWWELRFEAPIINLNLFRNKIFSVSIVTILILQISTSSMWFLLSFYLQSVKLISAYLTGLILVIQPLTVVLLSVYTGVISDKIKINIVPAAGLLLSTLGLIIFANLDEKTSIEFLIVGLLLLGAGVALFSSPTTNATMGSVSKRYYGMASAAVSNMVFTGQLLSMGIVLMIFSISTGKSTFSGLANQCFLNCMKTIFSIYTIISVAGIILTLIILKKKN